MLFGSISCLNSGLSRRVGGGGRGGENDYLSSHGGLGKRTHSNHLGGKEGKVFLFLQTTARESDH